jgi:hypothetical protein
MSNQRPDVEARITVGDLAGDNRDLLLIALKRNFLTPRRDIPEKTMIKLCLCGSGLHRYPLHDGYDIFLTFACEKCEKEKLSKFRPDIMERYPTDEQIENDY